MNYFVKCPVTGKHPWMPRHLPEASDYAPKALAERRAKLAMTAFNIDLSQLEHELRQLGISLKDALLAYTQQANEHTEKAIEDRYASLMVKVEGTGQPPCKTLQSFLEHVQKVMTCY